MLFYRSTLLLVGLGCESDLRNTCYELVTLAGVLKLPTKKPHLSAAICRILQRPIYD